MPNYISNYLHMVVPVDKSGSFFETMKGPAFWPHPIINANGAGLTHAEQQQISNHMKADVQDDPEGYIARFRDTYSHLRPAWMPVSEMDIFGMLVGSSELDAHTVPFSLPALAPWEGREEFDSLFPGQMTGAFWSLTEEARGRANSGHLGSIGMNRKRLGVKWTPQDIVVDQDEHPAQAELIRVKVTFLTPWSGIENLLGIMDDFLRTHGAKACYITIDEELNSDFAYSDPARDIYLFEDFHDTMMAQEKDEEGYLQYWTDWDKLLSAVVERIDDPDMQDFL